MFIYPIKFDWGWFIPKFIIDCCCEINEFKLGISFEGIDTGTGSGTGIWTAGLWISFFLDIGSLKDLLKFCYVWIGLSTGTLIDGGYIFYIFSTGTSAILWLFLILY